MRRIVKPLFFLALVGASSALHAGPPGVTSPPLSEQAKIAALLEAVTKARFRFVRNGIAYSPAQARRHMELKLSRSGGRVRTADQFIRYIASRSSITGRPYLVRFPDGREQPAEVWLRQQLREIERGARKEKSAAAPRTAPPQVFVAFLPQGPRVLPPRAGKPAPYGMSSLSSEL